MPGIENINFNMSNINNYTEKLNINITESDNEQKNLNPVKRPITIDSSNNIFYINYKDKNKVVRIDPGEYNLMELTLAIQNKVNETFGSGKVRVEITGSGSDRLLKATQRRLFEFLEKED